MSARSSFPWSGRGSAAMLLAWGSAVALTMVAAGRVGADDPPPSAAAELPVAAPSAPNRGSPSRPDYDCSKGGFCGTEGWEYGSYATDTKESTGCGPGPDGVDLWDLSASHSPTLPDFAKPYCAFFYGFSSCSLPTVICEN